MQTPRAVLFDLDNTLADRMEGPTPEMVAAFSQLLERLPCAIITAASIERIERLVLSALPADAKKENLYLLPDMAGTGYRWEGGWKPFYEDLLTPEESAHILEELKRAVEETGIIKDAPQQGERYEAHRAQVIFTALGLEAPKAEKEAWDPDQEKRKKLIEVLQPRLPGFDIYIGGRTTIDIARHGIDKGYGVRKFAAYLGCEPREMLFVGDELYPGGNDAVVIPTGIEVRQIANPAETLAVIRDLLTS